MFFIEQVMSKYNFSAKEEEESAEEQYLWLHGECRVGAGRGEGKAAQSHRQDALPAAYPRTGCHFKITKVNC